MFRAKPSAKCKLFGPAHVPPAAPFERRRGSAGEMVLRAEEVGFRKAVLPLAQMFTLAVLAGAFIALGGVFATTVTAGAAGVLSFGVTKLLVGWCSVLT